MEKVVAEKMQNPSLWNDERFKVGLQLVEQASALSRQVQKRIGEQFHSKADSSPVTVADLSVQLLVALVLKERFPEDVLVAEETAESLLQEDILRAMLYAVTPYVGERTTSEIMECFKTVDVNPGEQRWILDPIDGTKGFLRGDQFTTALAYADGPHIRFGLLACPCLSLEGNKPGDGVVGAAYQGRGAWQKPIGTSEWERVTVSKETDVTHARLLRSFEASHTNEEEIEMLVEALCITAEPVRLDSQAKYLLLARGDAEVVVRCLSPTQPRYKEKVWDQAAGSLVVSEAGGRICDLAGKPLDFSCGRTLEKNVGVLASNGGVHLEILESLRVL